jgi:hypothetical protein
MITETELEQIEKRCSKPQQDPWLVSINAESQYMIHTHVETATASTEDRLPDEFRQRLPEFPNLQDDYGYVKLGVATDVIDSVAATLDFVAHSRSDVPRLVNEIHRLKEENATLKNSK